MHNYKELKIWKRGRELVKIIYETTNNFPKSELYALVNQIRRSAVSIPSNIAEGAGRTTNKEFLRFLDIANGSAFELETQIYLSFDLGYINDSTLNEHILIIQEIQKMIYNLKLKIESDMKRLDT